LNSEQANSDKLLSPPSAEKAIASSKIRLTTLIAGSFGTHCGLVRVLLGEAEYLACRVNRFLQPNFAATRRLVFVCLGNINRSAFAEAVAASMEHNSASIGLSTSTGNPAFHVAIDTARKSEINLQAYRATDFTDYEYREGDLLLAMEIRHAHRLASQGIPQEAINFLGRSCSIFRRFYKHGLEASMKRLLFCILDRGNAQRTSEPNTSWRPTE
jgi:protein-tyrosine phosphatase